MSFSHLLIASYKPPQSEDPLLTLILALLALPRDIRLVIFLDSLDQLSAYGKVILQCLYS